MNPPSRLPATEDDLAEWSVYADHLITQGDPLGEYLARELALPAVLERPAVAEFQRAAKRVCKQGKAVRVAWCLGHVRTLTIPPATLSGVGVQYIAPHEGALARATQILRSPTGQLVESLRFVCSPDTTVAHWNRLFAALPPTCRRIEVGMLHATRSAIEDLLARLPATVRELVYLATFPTHAAPDVATAAISDRFDSVDLRTSDIATLASFAGPIAARLAEVDALQVRVHRIGGPAGAMPRCTLGAPGDAAIVVPSVGVAYTLMREPLLDLQQRAGIIPVRTQLARILPENHMDTVRWEGGHNYALVRRGESWTYQSAVGAAVFDIEDGCTFSEHGLVLVTHDVDARCRALLGLSISSR